MFSVLKEHVSGSEKTRSNGRLRLLWMSRRQLTPGSSAVRAGVFRGLGGPMPGWDVPRSFTWRGAGSPWAPRITMHGVAERPRAGTSLGSPRNSIANNPCRSVCSKPSRSKKLPPQPQAPQAPHTPQTKPGTNRPRPPSPPRSPRRESEYAANPRLTNPTGLYEGAPPIRH